MTTKLKVIQKLLGFDDQKGMQCQAIMPGEKHVWIEHPQMYFKPMGLIVWGASDQTFIDDIQCGNQCEVGVSASAIPARYFETGRSFEDVLKLAEVGELELSLPQRQVLKMATLVPGMTMRVSTSGPFSQFCVWGVMPSDNGPLPREVNIEKDPTKGDFIGTVVQHTLDGAETLMTVHAPTPEACAVILSSSPQRYIY